MEISEFPMTYYYDAEASITSAAQLRVGLVGVVVLSKWNQTGIENEWLHYFLWP